MPWNRQPVLIVRGWQVALASAFFIFVVVGSSNAVNLTDGLDGLAAGCAICVCIALIVGALLSADPRWASSVGLPNIPEGAQVAIYLSGLAGGLGGFLLYNHHPARIFMGDVGSLSLGAILGCASPFDTSGVVASAERRRLYSGNPFGDFTSAQLSLARWQAHISLLTPAPSL